MKTKRKTATNSKIYIPVFVWFQLAFIFFLVNTIGAKSIQLRLVAQSCMTTQQVQADLRCLYIYGHNIYEIGSRNKPHQRNPCGTDVSTKLPSSHNKNVAKFLVPNVVSSVCTNAVSTPTQEPTTTPTKTPTPTPLQPTQNSPTATPDITKTPTPTKRQTVASQLAPSPEKPTIKVSMPPATTTQDNQPLDGFLTNTEELPIENNSVNDIFNLSMPNPTTGTFTFLKNYIWWSQLLTIASFFLLIGSIIMSYIRPSKL